MSDITPDQHTMRILAGMAVSVGDELREVVRWLVDTGFPTTWSAPEHPISDDLARRVAAELYARDIGSPPGDALEGYEDYYLLVLNEQPVETPDEAGGAS